MGASSRYLNASTAYAPSQCSAIQPSSLNASSAGLFVGPEAHLEQPPLGGARVRQESAQTTDPVQVQPVQVRTLAVQRVADDRWGEEPLRELRRRETRPPRTEVTRVEDLRHQERFGVEGRQEVGARRFVRDRRVGVVAVERARGVADRLAQGVVGPGQRPGQAERRVAVRAGAVRVGDPGQPGEQRLREVLRQRPYGLGPTDRVRVARRRPVLELAGELQSQPQP
jgi:hypothetical protein